MQSCFMFLLRNGFIKEYFQKQFPQMEIYYEVVKNDNLLSSLDSYIKSNHIDIITLTSYKRNIFSRLFNPGIARKMIFHSDTPLLVIYGRPNQVLNIGIYGFYPISALCLIWRWNNLI